MPLSLRIEAYAIISADGMIADATGAMPDALQIDADKRFFERGLDGVDVVVHGRHSHEGQARSPLRSRIILTRQVATLAPDAADTRILYWNPAGIHFEDALAALGKAEGQACIVGTIGGGHVFDLFLGRYDVFYLTRVPWARLPGGRPIFPSMPSQSPEDVLARHGLVRGPAERLDAAQQIEVESWIRPD